MKRKRPNKEAVLKCILIEIEKGGTYAKTSSYVCGKFQFTDRTFSKYWGIANGEYLKGQEGRLKALADTYTQAEVNRLKKAILTKDEALELLTKTAKGQGEVNVGKLVVPTYAERTAAIKTMSDMLAWNAPKDINMNMSIEEMKSDYSNVLLLANTDE